MEGNSFSCKTMTKSKQQKKAESGRARHIK